jgi:hypothetical protein
MKNTNVNNKASILVLIVIQNLLGSSRFGTCLMQAVLFCSKALNNGQYNEEQCFSQCYTGGILSSIGAAKALDFCIQITGE